jgi:hypothetical protein
MHFRLRCYRTPRVAARHAGIADFHTRVLARDSDTCKPLEKLGQGGGVKTDREC